MSGGWATTRPVALDMLTVQLADELRDTPNKVNSSDPGLTATDLNGHRGYQTVEQDGAETIRLALLPANGPTGRFLSVAGPNPWWRASLRSWKRAPLGLDLCQCPTVRGTRVGTTVENWDRECDRLRSNLCCQSPPSSGRCQAFGRIRRCASRRHSDEVQRLHLVACELLGSRGVRVREAGGRSRKAYLARTSWITRPRHWRP
jgi:hypothetical protein